MPDGGDAKVFEIVSRQLGQNRGVNLIFPERLLVALQTKLPQPSCDVHDVPIGMVIGGESYQSDGSEAINPSSLLRPLSHPITSASIAM